MGKFSAIYDRSRVPLYLQVASVMRQRINSGHWVEGERISTLEELEEEFGVARVTIRQAIELLRAEGLLHAQQGRGTFVSSRPANNRWLNLATDFDSLVESIRNNVLKRVFIQRDAEPPVLIPGEGNPATGLHLPQKRPIQQRQTLFGRQPAPRSEAVLAGQQALHALSRAAEDRRDGGRGYHSRLSDVHDRRRRSGNRRSARDRARRTDRRLPTHHHRRQRRRDLRRRYPLPQELLCLAQRPA